eukprot:6226066-Prymnesium_polylepis.2
MTTFTPVPAGTAAPAALTMRGADPDVLYAVGRATSCAVYSSSCGAAAPPDRRAEYARARSRNRPPTPHPLRQLRTSVSHRVQPSSTRRALQAHPGQPGAASAARPPARRSAAGQGPRTPPAAEQFH